MPYDGLIDRASLEAADLIPSEQAASILKVLPESSAALALCRQMRMSTKTLTQPVLASRPAAYWVAGDTGLKQTTDVSWAGVSMTAEEMATIVPIPEAVIDDAGFPIWNEIRPLLVEAMGRLLDDAVFTGTNKPATWPEAIIPAATAAGNVQVSESGVNEGGVAGDLDLTMALVEDDGYDVTGFALDRSMRGYLRRARDASGQKLLDVSQNEIEGVPVSYVPYGVLGTGAAPTVAITGDWNMAIIGVRQDISWKLLDQAVISDDTGKVILNLAQQDAVAMRVVARYGYALAQPLSHSANANPFPFAILNGPIAGAPIAASSSRGGSSRSKSE